jgi:hypothetical protein
MNATRLGGWRFALAAAVCAAAWTARIATSPGPLHDEGITLLAAQAREGVYGQRLAEGLPPFGVVVPARQWQDFTSGPGAVSFRRLRDDVARNDLHPPLAFWAYNVWLRLFPRGGYSEALVLTAIIMLCAAGVFHRVARLAGATPDMARLLTLLYLLTNAAMSTAAYVRQYALLTLLVAATVLLCLMLVRGRGCMWVAPLIGATALLGVLTQYLYTVQTLSLHAIMVLTLATRRAYRCLAALLLAYAAAGAAFLILMPGALDQATRERTVEPWPERLHGAWWGLAGLLVPNVPSLPQWASLLVAILGLGAVLASLVVAMRSDEQLLRVLAAAGLGSLLLQALLVLTGRFPSWALSPPYTCALLIFALPVAAAVWPSRFRHRAVGGALIASLAFAHLGYSARRLRTAELTPGGRVAAWAPSLVLLSTPTRGDVLPITIQLPPDTPVLVGSGSALRSVLSKTAAAPYARVLWFRERDARGGADVLEEFRSHGFSVRPLPTLHPGFHDVFLAERGQSG